MGIAIDTVQAFSTQGALSAFPTALAAAPGDSLTVRNFLPSDWAKLEAIIYSAGGGQKMRITSPRLHDPNTGLTLQPGEVPSAFALPRESGVQLYPGDTLTAQGAIGAAGTITLGLVNYYSNLQGTSARLHMWGDISGIIKAYKTVEVDLGAIAVGAWTDTLITSTENQLHAGSDYAILGYEVNPAVDIVGVKGAFTGNLRVCGPGPVSTLAISEYFVTMSEKHGTPHIPVFNANDRFAVYVSAANHAAIAGGAASVYLILAELTQTVTP